jgi:putative flippase GtrA
MSLIIYSGQYSLYLAMFWGTLAGLIVKYILDKKYIFQFQTKDIKEDSFKFILYSLMGILTTLIFWGFELTFNAVFSLDSAKYVGAVIGLSIGYMTKYQLDKRYVFVWKDRH